MIGCWMVGRLDGCIGWNDGCDQPQLRSELPALHCMVVLVGMMVVVSPSLEVSYQHSILHLTSSTRELPHGAELKFR